MDYKDVNSLTDSYLVFSKALELKCFDESSPNTVAVFLDHLGLAPYRNIAEQKDLVQPLRWLNALEFVRPSDGELEVTSKAIEWGQVFQIRSDGTFVLFEHTVEASAWPTFKAALGTFANYLNFLWRGMNLHLEGGEHTPPLRLSALTEATNVLGQMPLFPGTIVPLAMYREAAVLACREEMLRLRERKETLNARARDRKILEGTENKIRDLEHILARPGLSGALITSKPRLTDFVNVGFIEAASKGRATDEKFGILAAPALFSTDYTETADGAFSRDRSFAVGFVDIDNFKAFNDLHLETVVDRDMLPHFMRALEAYCYARAYAYRQGGDEYLILLRNADKLEARAFFKGLQAHIARINYPDSIPSKPTVSIGVHVIDGNHEVTVFEAQKLANDAKDAAKDSGRNYVHLSSDPPPEPRKPRKELP